MLVFVPWHHSGELVAAGIAAALICAGLIVALMPLLQRYALARPNARSSHVVPTPQGGGIAVVIAMSVVVIPAMLLTDTASLGQLWVLLGAAAFLAVVGAVDDIRTIEALPRLILQFVAVGVVVVYLPEELRVIPLMPLWLERILLIVAGVWAVNLVNFMDGIDWITVT